MPQAYREIERLRQKVNELEHELKQERDRSESLDLRLTPSNTATPSASESTSAPTIYSDLGIPQSFWKGIHVRTARSPNETWYGASSLFYFIGRMSAFLNPVRQQAAPADHLLDLNPTTTLLDGSAAGRSDNIAESRAPQREPDQGSAHPEDGEYLTPMQEEYFLELYWQSYHTALFPILDETEFKAHYRSLWTSAGNGRRPSALADITIALSMQYGVAMMPATKQMLVVDNSSDPTVSGRWYYLRSQRLLAYEMESPSISTMQCHLLFTIYLCCGTFQNMADSAYSLAVRTAYMLGLHLEPPATMPLKERELRKRLWWALYMLDSKIGMKLGRPFLIPQSNEGPRLPSDQLDVAMQSGSNFAPLGDNVTWLSFSLQHTRLFQTARVVHTAFYSKEMTYPGTESIWDNPSALDAHAAFLNSCMKDLDDWATELPPALQTKRQNNGRSFSTDGSSLAIEPFAPLWLQRQRILLELVYHHLSTNLYRPFISFSPAPVGALAEESAVKGALHAMALTSITHEVLSSTSILAGWHEAFQWQWNGAMTLVGFALAYPQNPTTTAARKSIDLALTVFDIFGTSFAVATSASSVVKKLATKIDLLVQQSQERQASLQNSNETNQQYQIENAAELGAALVWPTDHTAANSGVGGQGFGDFSTGFLQDVFDTAFDIDQWSELNMLWPSTENIMIEA
ncbi:hypothetical protein GQ53DRAFT_744778 [Thozetella sp. PMI_491]|nr:hypothetical protein GQ53DRAFT_744778 [Thozetella sp. PMI_491]